MLSSHRFATLWLQANIYIYIFVKKTSHVPITWWANRIFTHLSMASSMSPFFVLRWNKVLISSVRVLQCGDVMFCYMFNTQLFLWPEHLPHTEHSISFPTIFSHGINLIENTQSSRNGCLGSEGIWACTSQKTHKLEALVATVTRVWHIQSRTHRQGIM